MDAKNGGSVFRRLKVMVWWYHSWHLQASKTGLSRSFGNRNRVFG